MAHGDDGVIVDPFAGGQAVFLDKEMFRLFHSAHRFRSLADHASAYLSGLNRPSVGETRDEVESKLRYLEALGLLIRDSLIRQSGLGGHEPYRSISSVGIVTKDRPQLLKRCVDSLKEHALSVGGEISVRVYDDSKTPHTAALIRSQRLPTSLSLLYASVENKLRFLRHLDACLGLGLDLLTFAFSDSYSCGPTFGANLNCLLLDTCGQLSLAVDDDIIWKAGVPRGVRPELKLSSLQDPTIIDLCANPDEAERSVTWGGANLLQVHAQYLGRSLSSCIQSAEYTDGPVDLSAAETGTGAFLDPESATVSVSMCGIVGDPGTSTSSWCIRADRLPQLVRAEDMYASLKDTRNIVRSVRQPTISDCDFFMNAFCGFDNRSFLPPFFPVLRNMDGLFASLLRVCSDRSLIAYLPFVVPHEPERAGRPKLRPFEFRPRLCDLIIQFVKSATRPQWYQTPYERLFAVGQHLAEIGNLREKPFKSWLHLQFHQHWATQVLTRRRLLLVVNPSCVQWKADMNTQLAQLQETMGDGTCCSIADLAGVTSSVAEMEAVAKTLITQFGQLLINWKTIRETSKYLHSKGIYIAEPIRR